MRGEVRSLLAGVRSDIGQVRNVNQDYVLLSEPYNNGLMLAIVADGMGGHLAGEVASKMAAEAIYQELDPLLNKQIASVEQYKFALEQAIFFANEKVYQASLVNEEYKGMGTTIVAGIFHDNWIVLGHIGDSRAYLINNEGIIQLTADHSLVNELLQNGQISQEEADSHPKKNILMRALGTEATAKIDIQVTQWEKEQTMLLCTDGLTNQLTNQEIFEVVQSGTFSAQDMAEHLLSLANQAGGEDNISVIVVQHDN